jgi:Membrane carboxypeptidase (penicillin-binding protein)
MPKPKPRKRLRPRGFFGRWKWVLDPARGFAPHPGDAGGGGAIHQSSVDAADVDRQGGAMFSSGPSVRSSTAGSLPQIPEMFLEHLWISEDQRFFQHEGFDWKEMDLA